MGALIHVQIERQAGQDNDTFVQDAPDACTVSRALPLFTPWSDSQTQ